MVGILCIRGFAFGDEIMNQGIGVKGKTPNGNTIIEERLKKSIVQRDKSRQ